MKNKTYKENSWAEVEDFTTVVGNIWFSGLIQPNLY